jgi:hypothetical protein
MRKLLPVALVAALVAGGCGGGGKSEESRYAKAVTQAQVDLATTLNRAQRKTAKSAQEAAGQATAIKAAIEKDAATLRALKPPAKVAALHRQLITELQQLAGGIGDMAAAFKTNDKKALATAREKVVLELANVGTRIEGTIAAINKKLRS